MPTKNKVFKFYTLVCSRCEARLRQARWDDDPWPEHCGVPMEDTKTQGLPAPGVIGDECDVWVRHGICHEDGSPKHFTSKAAMRAEAKALGLVNAVRHVPERGSDKSRITTKWV